jgi:hypothetical protein
MPALTDGVLALAPKGSKAKQRGSCKRRHRETKEQGRD